MALATHDSLVKVVYTGLERGLDRVEMAVSSREFINCQQIILIPNAAKLPEFKYGFGNEDLAQPDFLSRILARYKGDVTVRSYSANFEVSINFTLHIIIISRGFYSKRFHVQLMFYVVF